MSCWILRMIRICGGCQEFVVLEFDGVFGEDPSLRRATFSLQIGNCKRTRTRFWTSCCWTPFKSNIMLNSLTAKHVLISEIYKYFVWWFDFFMCASCALKSNGRALCFGLAKNEHRWLIMCADSKLLLGSPSSSLVAGANVFELYSGRNLSENLCGVCSYQSRLNRSGHQVCR